MAGVNQRSDMRNESDADKFIIDGMAKAMVRGCFGWEGEWDVAEVWSCPEEIKLHAKRNTVITWGGGAPVLGCFKSFKAMEKEEIIKPKQMIL